MKAKKIISASLVGSLALALAVSVSASSNTVQKNITYRDIKITMNGEQITPRDVNGNLTEPFIMDDSTYLPVRAIAGALGLEVDWDGETSTVILRTPGSVQPAPEQAQEPATRSLIHGLEPSTTVYVSNRSNTIHFVHDCPE